MNENCGCCEGTQKITPLLIANLPGLSELVYRVGTHESFLETMKARLSSLGITPAEMRLLTKDSDEKDLPIYPLQALTTRSAADFSIALLDAWAMIADVLTFYQERLANEGYLRTATERRSILELARLVGYSLRPGVSASVYLAYTVEPGAETTIPKGSRSQSLPGAGELPQSFETSEVLLARDSWNNLQPRLTRPQFITPDNADIVDILYFQGVSTNLKPNDRLLLLFAPADPSQTNPPSQFVRSVKAVEPQAAEKRTMVTLHVSLSDDQTLSRAVQQTLGRYLDLNTFCISLKDPLASEVNHILQGFLLNLPAINMKQLVAVIEEAFQGKTPYPIPSPVTLQELVQLLVVYLVKKVDEAFTDGKALVMLWLKLLVADVQKVLSWVVPTAGTSDMSPTEDALSSVRSAILAQSSTCVCNLVDVPALVAPLAKPTSLQPPNSQRLGRDTHQAFAAQSDVHTQLLTVLNPSLQTTLYSAIAAAPVTPPPALQSVQAFQVKAAPFGHNAPLKPVLNEKGIITGHEEWPLTTMATEVKLAALSMNALISITKNTDVQSEQVSFQHIGCSEVALNGNTVNTNILATGSTTLTCIHFVYASAGPDIGPVDVYVDKKRIFKSISIFDIGEYVNLQTDADPIHIQVTLPDQTPESTSPLIDVHGAFEPSKVHTIIATADGPVVDGNKGIVIHEDNITPTDAGHARVRVIQASHVSDIHSISLPSEEPSPLPSFGTATEYILPPIGTYTLLGFSGEQSIPLGSITLTDGNIYDIILLDPSDSHQKVTVVVRSAPSKLSNDEKVRLTFSFLELQRKVRVISDKFDMSKVTSLAVQVVDGDEVLTQPASSNQFHSYSRDGGAIIITTGASALDLTVNEAQTIPIPNPKEFILDAPHDQITPGSWVVIERSDKDKLIISKVTRVQPTSLSAYGITGSVTKLTLEQPWLDANDLSLSVLRGTTIYAQSTARTLAEETIDPIAEAVCGKTIELDGLYDGLQSGRWLIITGERTDIFGVQGVIGSELVMLSKVAQGLHQVVVKPTPMDTSPTISLPGDKTHSFITLANDLAYSYKRDTVTIYGNVVQATHGETHSEVLGSGDGTKALQQFQLRKSPLTYVPAPIAAGVISTLQVRVNTLLWQETERLVAQGPVDRIYMTLEDDDSQTSVVFGTGEHGARLPTGIENVGAVYRFGIGTPGNVKAKQISLLPSRPLGVKSVINPLAAAGGADRESRDLARRNVPLGVKALDRLVSVEDYADFARTFAGIGKAGAVRLPNGHRQVIHLTIVGANTIPIDENSALFQNLFQALRLLGDPFEPLQVAFGEILLLVISANVRLLPEYDWESVEPVLRSELLNAFGFERRELSQNAFLSEAMSVLQNIAGVDYVEMKIFDTLAEKDVENALSEVDASTQPATGKMPTAGSPPAGLPKNLELRQIIPVYPARIDPKSSDRNILPAQLAFLSPDVHDTLILNPLL